MSGIAVDSDGIQLGDSSRDKSRALELSKPSRMSVARFGNESSSKPSKPWICDYLGGDAFDKGHKPIDDSVFDRIHPGLTGMRTCTVANNLFFSSLQLLNREHDLPICLCVSAVQMSAASTSHDLILTPARHSQVHSRVRNES